MEQKKNGHYGTSDLFCGSGDSTKKTVSMHHSQWSGLNMMGQLLLKLGRRLQAQLPNPPIQCFPVSEQLHQVHMQPWLPNEDSYSQLLFPDDTVMAVSSPDPFLSNITADNHPTLPSLSKSPSSEHKISSHAPRTTRTTQVVSPQLPPNNSVLNRGQDPSVASEPVLIDP